MSRARIGVVNLFLFLVESGESGVYSSLYLPWLITWVTNTADILEVADSAGSDIDTPTALNRDELKWDIGLTDDGRLLAGGM